MYRTGSVRKSPNATCSRFASWRSFESRSAFIGGSDARIIMGGDEAEVSAQVRRLGEERGVRAEIAYDGLRVALRGARRARSR